LTKKVANQIDWRWRF